MADYQELKRLAEAAKACAHLSYYTLHEGDFQAAASPDVVLGLIKALEHAQMAAKAEAKELDERNAVIAKLRAQNQALTKRLEDADYLVRAFENGCDASDYARDIEDYRAAEGGV